MFFLLRIIKRVASLGIVLIAVAAVATAATLIVIPQAVTIVTANEGTAADLELDVLAERSSMFAADGSFLTLLTEVENREPISLDEMPQEVIDAILAVEDADFYEHDGVNLRATFRALVENVNAGGIAQGGSTITQQLVKNAILTPEQNLNRKTTEAFYALRLERQMTKDEILERYLNTVYFGAGAYGVQAAAETYWGYDSASELGWAEAALLAGVIRNPSRFDPTRFPDDARVRRSIVLDRLVTTGHLTREEADEYEFAILPAERQEPFDRAPTDYFIQDALEQVLNDESILGGDAALRFNAVYRGGLKIYTTFDPKAQDAALRARDELVPDIKANCYNRQRRDGDPNNECIPEFTVAIASIDSHTGAVRALVGGPEFQRERFNLATQGKRQPGSSMKTLVLAALFEADFTPADSVRTDRPCTFPNPGGVPNPYVVDRGSGGRAGISSIASATRASNNCSFVRLGQVVGNDAVIDVATRLGVDTSEMTPQLSLPLGSFEITPMDMAGAYASFANDGIYNEPWFIERIEDRDGNVIYEHRPDGSRAVRTQTARLIAETLQGNIDLIGGQGTGRRARLEGHFAAGKTGTAQNNEDAWFVGFTDYYTTAVWLGDPNEKIRIEFPEWGQRGWSGSGRGGFGGELPAEVWGAYMTEIHADLEPRPFAPPDPYGGGRYLRAPGEIDFCSLSDVGGSTRNTQLFDSDGDGRNDCFRPVTTTT
ncbi:MAG: transglycosylase domain-containing protein, partial [Acidimicrobiia bacterium]|nr:transglycosylase domain-containing protein [Acidimicrobiia bacterium]